MRVMTTKTAKTTYETVIGLEIHVEIGTQSKMFCGCSARAFNAEPNQNTCPVCMGFPGQLPVINREAVRYGVLTALALNCDIPRFSKFDRKNYFYPDLPKGFQISQYDKPISLNGHLTITIDGADREIRITRLHLEDDAGKLTHIEGGTLCDYNRSGIGLMEIVSEPDIRTSAEAVAYAKEVQSIVRYVGASEADMEKGMMRFDASVSLRPAGETKLYPRAEIKNLNSFRSLQSAIEFEVTRQKKLWEANKYQSSDITVGWSDEKQATYFMRDKEGADDYRYFPEPDLPPLIVEQAMVSELCAQLPELPRARRMRYIRDFGISEAEAYLLSDDKVLADYFERVLACTTYEPKKAASFICTVVLRYLNDDARGIAECPVNSEQLGGLLTAVATGRISNNMAKGEVFEEMYLKGSSADEVITNKGLAQVSDTAPIEEACRQIIADNADTVADYKAGKTKVFGFLVGKAMAQMKGKANPQLVNDIMKRLVEEA